ncbi:MAG: hypothetical protein NZM04_04325 [Methylacidiphilales bacterium]|nr:hypothetical protein [Candidatus Methylacidiphilales bacterium]MDW8349688.1 hypothetical protein [Verrucomicrobiae bacterium]
MSASPSTSPNSSPRDPKTLRGQLLALLGFLIFGIAAYYLITTERAKNPTFDEKAAQARLERLSKLQEEERLRLHSYGWIDQAAGIVHIPIEKAIPLTVKELSQKPVGPGNPITTPPIPSPPPPPSPQ